MSLRTTEPHVYHCASCVVYGENQGIWVSDWAQTCLGTLSVSTVPGLLSRALSSPKTPEWEGLDAPCGHPAPSGNAHGQPAPTWALLPVLQSWGVSQNVSTAVLPGLIMAAESKPELAAGGREVQAMPWGWGHQTQPNWAGVGCPAGSPEPSWALGAATEGASRAS